MPKHLTEHYGPAEGPLGFPVTDKQAFALEAILKALPKDAAYAYRKAVVEKATTELSPGERSDVSWISTEDPDRTGDVVVAKGMNDGQFRLNPIVTLNHAYNTPPVGRSLWRKFVKDGTLRGIKAKTQYPRRPTDWPADADWPADVAFALVQADLLRGKSIGFLPTRVHVPDEKELTKNGWSKVGLVIDEWILLEYACVFLPAQQNAVVQAVSKSAPCLSEELRKALGIESILQNAAISGQPPTAPAPPDIIPFISLADIEKEIRQAFLAIDPLLWVERVAQDRIDRLRGRI
jgi:hypothetical protein